MSPTRGRRHRLFGCGQEAGHGDGGGQPEDQSDGLLALTGNGQLTSSAV